MQTFINPSIPLGEPGHCWQFNDNVRVEVSTVSVGDPDDATTEERRQFFAPHGAKLNVPDTLVPGELPVPSLDDLKVAKVASLSGSCKQQIVAGFPSSALGQTHLYPTKETDQMNLNSSVLDSLMPNLPTDWTTPFWCSNEAGVWQMRAHTAAQIQQVGQDVKAKILHCMGKNVTLATQAMLAETVEELNAIKWEDPVHADL